MTTARSEAERLEPADAAGTSVRKARLSAEGVTFGYSQGAPILIEWTASFAGGEMVAITGPSGRGKSTLLYLLGLMLKPQSGRVLVDGEDVLGFSDARSASLRAHLFGFVFQDAALDTGRTVLDNVIETALYRGQARKEAARQAVELLDRFGVHVPAGRKPGQVSGGQAQRIALARALLNDPRILLADEPTGNLDPVSADVVVEAMRQQARRGSAVVIATHDPRLVERCDRRIQL